MLTISRASQILLIWLVDYKKVWDVRTNNIPHIYNEKNPYYTAWDKRDDIKVGKRYVHTW